MRVTDEMVRGVLTWARNYGEIEAFEAVAPRGRRWKVTLPAALTIGAGASLGLRRSQDVVPSVLVFTSREAVAFGYGCAAGGVHDRAAFARERWGW